MRPLLHIAMDMAALNRITGQQAMAALESCIAGDNKPLRRLGYLVTMEMPTDEALAIVANDCAGQAEAWALTYDGTFKTVHD
jgi:hypothetical protein